MYFHKPQEKPRLYGNFQDRQYSIWRNLEDIYRVDHESEVLIIPGFWGLPLLDYSGKNNHGTNHGSTYKDGSLDFDGTNDYVDVTGISQHDDKTIIAWINTGIDNVYQEIFSYCDRVSDVDYRFNEFRLTNAGKLQYWDNEAPGGEGVGVATTDDVPLNEQVMVVMTKSGVNVKLYINGIEKASSASFYAFSFTPQQSLIGAFWWAAPPGQFLNGTMDEVRIANVPRTADQVALFHDLPYGLYQPVIRPVYFFQAAAGGVAPTSTIYGPLSGPFAGPI